MVRAITSSPTGPQLGRAPPFLRALLTFPYAHGLGFVREVRRRQPWSAFSKLYADPPRSSSQILHPELYLDGRIDPVTVELPDLGSALGDGATRIVVDQAGEFGLTGVLREHLGEQAAATGWRGDSYAVWQPPGGARDVLLARTLWETDAAAGAFATAYRQLLAKRRGLVPKPAVAGVTAWEVDGALFAVAEREREVLVLEQAPARQADGLARALGIPFGSGGLRPAP
jgi:hypothetical protein